MKISILTPTLNHGQYLADAIESVRRQSALTEHIVADGGSQDETCDVLSQYGSDIQWVSEPDRGQSDALNRALDLSNGEIIGWLNADEFYLPGSLRLVTERFGDDPELDVLVGDAVLIDRGGKALRLYATHRLSRPALTAYDCYILTSSLFIRRSAMRKFRWDVDLRLTMDWDLLLALITQGARVGIVNRPISAFRVYPEQAGSRLSSRRAAEIRRLAERYDVPLGPGHSNAALAGRLHRVGMKIVGGSYGRELSFLLSQRCRDMRWMARGGTSGYDQ